MKSWNRFDKEKFRTILIIVLVISVLVLSYLFYKYIYNGTVRFTDVVYNEEYSVRNTDYKQLSAKKLATIDARLKAIIEALRNDSEYIKIPKIKNLISIWDKGVSIKEIGNMETDAAYVLNKKHMAFCLHNTPDPLKSNQSNLEDDNLLAYAAIHELAHIMSDEIGHGSEFVANFKILLQFSKNVKYFDKYQNKTIPVYIELSHYSSTPDSYCGVGIKNTID